MPPATAAPARPEPEKVSRCKKPGHGERRTGCDPCTAYSAYHKRLRRWEQEHGVEPRFVPSGPIREHLHSLIRSGNLRLVDIARESGVLHATIRSIYAGRRRTTTKAIAVRLLAVRPRTETRPPQWGMVPNVEAKRIMRGLAAQGWRARYVGDLLGGCSRGATQRLLNHPGQWMLPATLVRVRAVARELGPYDVRLLDRPMPGMDLRTANYAAGRGWVPLWAWQGHDITDPDAEPAPVVVPDGDRGAGPVAFLDPVLRRRINEVAERLDQDPAAARRGRPGTAFIDPIGRLNRFEAYAVWFYADHAGLNSTQVARLLGYPMQTTRERAAGQRQIERVKSAVKRAQAWIESDPAGETPAWLSLSRRPNQPDFRRFLPVLMAGQKAPFGAGWELPELAKRCGVGEDDMREFLAYAIRQGNRRWSPGQIKRAAPPSCARRRQSALAA